MTDDYDRYSDDLGIKELRQELRRVKYNNKFAATLFNTVGTLVVVAAAAILVANLWLPILKGDRNIYVTDVTGGTGAYGIKGA